ncbi:unnamed protein product [Ambrosiozyma monospora]|uniref:Unnamed protein product n=1 Tax=Ambrosiozyma monospora TaxID=43982 RepID=A0ACB5TWK1_AMBMO|nr:unnamed protein product [Ambrosiozyma monospora]
MKANLELNSFKDRKFPSGNILYNTIVHRTQYPVKLAFASTIHTSQGRDLRSCLLKPSNSHCSNLWYAAFSRIIKPKNMGMLVDSRKEYEYSSSWSFGEDGSAVKSDTSQAIPKVLLN